jgi:hypothetical protein
MLNVKEDLKVAKLAGYTFDQVSHRVSVGKRSENPGTVFAKLLEEAGIASDQLAHLYSAALALGIQDNNIVTLGNGIEVETGYAHSVKGETEALALLERALVAALSSDGIVGNIDEPGETAFILLRKKV